MEHENNAYAYDDDDHIFMMEDSILTEESIVWAYRPGRVLVTGLYLDMDDDVIEQFREFRYKNIGLGWERLYKYIQSRGEMNQFRQDISITKQYMRYEITYAVVSMDILDFDNPSQSQYERLMNLYIFKSLPIHKKLNFRDMINDPQMG